VNKFTRILETPLVNSEFAHFCNFHLISRTRIRLEIELEFNQSKKRKPMSSLVKFALLSQNSIRSQSLV